ncbi:tRNA1(Val) (adenine(37)-N6)-methyltransferase [Candidatus Magnetomonas plexicatena]|uniref:tRNA1(Val) (adenine(37)-N6)-methyltransferase n=1 Tax=Candidatus Magnetomonas plexicatena TaxID=2552947 RepID=UPI0011037602|nr:tRNA1(Val) (adenine(37)-N6)-methyltransferase [Nitrospirales bacterium LBB_01]
MLTLDFIKDIKIYQRKSGYRFSVDALLLSDFVRAGINTKLVADFGAGSGIIGILLAKKFTKPRVHLVDIQEDLSALAKKNVEMNSLNDNITVHTLDVRKVNGYFSQNSFDIVVSNPPFRRPVTGMTCPDTEKAIARHEIKVTFNDLVDSAFYMLKGKGKFVFIYHPARFVETIETLRNNKFEPKRIRFIHSNTETEAKMFLMEAVKEGKPEIIIEPPLFLYEKQGVYTSEALSIIGKTIL